MNGMIPENSLYPGLRGALWLVLLTPTFACSDGGRSGGAPPENGSTDKSQVRASIQALESSTGLHFPAGAEVLAEEKSDRKDGHHQRWVVHSTSPIELPAQGAVDVPAESTIASLKARLSRRALGQPLAATAHSASWKNQNGSWGAYLVSFDTGYYLDISHAR
jgi:hypothetical protein